MKFRKASKADLPEVVRLLADDELGKTREKYEVPLPDVYYDAFMEMESQQGNMLILATEDEAIIGCLQLVLIPGISRLGMKRAQIEGVRVDKDYRGRKIGEKLFLEALRIAKEEKCNMIQLTTDKQRKDALRFYQKLGYQATHEGMKLTIENNL